MMDVLEILKGGRTVLISYDMNSVAWRLPFLHIVKSKESALVLNYTFPLSTLDSVLTVVLDDKREVYERIKLVNFLREDDLGESKHFEILQDRVLDIETMIPKVERALKEYEVKNIILATVDGGATLFGEKQFLKVIRRFISRLGGKFRFFLLLNRDAVSKWFSANLTYYADTVLYFETVMSEDGVYHLLYLLRLPVYGFVPSVFRVLLSGDGSLRVIENK